jgi:arylsulfatase
VDEDFAEANNLAAKNPDKLKELQDLFMKEAEKYHVLPIDDRRAERFNAAIAGRPDLIGDRTSLTVYPGMIGITENAFINIKNRSYSITGDVELPDGNANGVIISQAGRFGGWTLYMKAGKLHHEYNFFGLEHTNIASSKPISAGKHTVKYEFVFDGGKPGAGGQSILYVDGQKVAEGKIPKTQPYAYSADEGVDVGVDNETPVSNDYKERDNKFTGTIKKITVDVKPFALSAKDKKDIEDEEDAAAIAED